MKFFTSFSFTFRHFYEGKRGYSAAYLKDGRFLFHCTEEHVFPTISGRGAEDGFPKDVFDNVLDLPNTIPSGSNIDPIHQKDGLGQWTRYQDSLTNRNLFEILCPGIIAKWREYRSILFEKKAAGHILYCKRIDELFPTIEPDTHTNYIDTSEEARATFAKWKAKWKAEYTEKRSHDEPILRGGALPKEYK